MADVVAAADVEVAEMHGTDTKEGQPTPVENKENYIGAMTSVEYLSRPTNIACHDLYLENPMPQGTRRLMGLGPNFFAPHAPVQITESIEQLKGSSKTLE